MKKLYILSLMLLSTAAAMAQTIYYENFGTTAPSSSPYPSATDYTGYQQPEANYTGTADVRNTGAPSGSNTYDGASMGANVFFTGTAGRFLLIENINTSNFPSADLVLSFGQNQGSNSTTPSTNLLVEVSTDGTNFTPLTYTRTGTSQWQLITISGGVIPSTPNLRVRFTQASTIQYRIDDFKIAAFSASCALTLSPAVSTCTAFTLDTDTYSVSIPFSGGGTASYIINASLGNPNSGDNPTTATTGNIIIANIPEGQPTTITITGGTCNYTINVIGAACKPVNTLPYSESFSYNIGTSLTSQQRWTSVNSGDDISINATNLVYPGVTSTGQSAAFSGAGAEAWTPFTPVTTGQVYVAFLLDVADMANVTVDGTNTYFLGLTNGTNTAQGPGYVARLYIKKNADQYQLAFTTASSSTDATVYTSPYNVGATLMVVLSYDYTGNMLNAWINPDLATFNPATTAPTLTETPATAITGAIGGVMLRQDGSNNTPTIIIDELRVSTDFATLSTGRNNETIEGLTMYPNPVTGNVLHIATANSGEKAVAIYDVLGKQVVNTVTTESVNVSGLNSGVYIVKITEEGKTATKKLVIK